MSGIKEVRFETKKSWTAGGRNINAEALSVLKKDNGILQLFPVLRSKISFAFIIDFTKEEAAKLASIIADDYMEEVAKIYHWLKLYAKSPDDISFDTAKRLYETKLFARSGYKDVNVYYDLLEASCKKYVEHFNL